MVYHTLHTPLYEPSPRFIAVFCVAPIVLSTKPVKALLHQLVSIYS
jgi:hypothetical protein